MSVHWNRLRNRKYRSGKFWWLQESYDKGGENVDIRIIPDDGRGVGVHVGFISGELGGVVTKYDNDHPPESRFIGKKIKVPGEYVGSIERLVGAYDDGIVDVGEIEGMIDERRKLIGICGL